MLLIFNAQSHIMPYLTIFKSYMNYASTYSLTTHMATLLSSHTCLPKFNAQQSVALLSSLTVTQLVLLVRVRPLLFLSSSFLCCCCCCCQRFVSQSMPSGGRVHSGSGVNSMQIKHLRRALQFAKKYLLCFSLPLTVTKPMTSTIHTHTHSRIHTHTMAAS